MKITHFERYSKVLLIYLDNKFVIKSGLGMSGSWRLWNEIKDVPHTHMVIKCALKSNETIYLAYVDPRRFGKMHFYTIDEWKKNKSAMGVDVSSNKFNLEYLSKCIKKYPEKNDKTLSS